MNKITVSLLGKDYTLQTAESEGYVQSLAREIDRSIRDIMKADQALSLTSACILAAFDAYDSKTKLKTEGDNLRTQIKDYINEAVQANNKADELSMQVQALESENKTLQNKLELYDLKEKLDEQE